MEIPLLKDILIILGLGIFVLFVFNKLKLPPIVGFLLTGILTGPYGFHLVSAVKEVEILAEIGVILLLFSIGLEFSLKRLREIQSIVLLGGSTQVILAILLTMGFTSLAGFSLTQSVFIGFLVALSSTAIVLKLLQESGQMDTPHGRISVGILIFQDIMIVPMMLVVPMLSGDFQFDTLSVTTFFIKIAILLIFLFLLNRWIVPHILYQVTRTRSRELFLMTVAFLAFATAWLTSLVGLSLALGAFLAGLIVSESEYSSEAFANILPLRDIFLSFFFVSIGMLLDIRVILNNPLLILVSFIAILFIKMITAGFASLILGYSIRKILIVMFTLAQIGEFSFILFKVGMKYQLMPDAAYQNFLAVSVLTMMFSPFIFALGKYADQISRFIPFSGRLKLKEEKKYADLAGESVSDHLIIIGYGLNGQNLTRAAQALAIPYQVIDLNPDTVRREKKSGIKIFYGDATQKNVLKHANINTARVVVIAINDAAATRRITQLVREMNPAIYLITRTRYVQEVKALFNLGANEVIPEEYETSIEIFTRVLTKYLIPEQDINELVEKIRAEGYQALRISPPKGLAYLKTKIPQAEICTLEIPENSSIQGKTLGDIQIRKKYNVNLLAIQRQNKIIFQFTSEHQLEKQDQLIVLGTPKDISTFAREIDLKLK